jgi:two-component system alkaline phosphatase synthesis response regulator PhoP
MEKKLLIVDDEAPIRMLLEQSLEDLEDEGVELLQASNGQEALEMIQAERPALVFLDVMMPLMNGLEVCRMVKKEMQMEGVYIVLLTAKGQEMDRQKGMEVGADQYLTKPFDPDALLSLAEEVLNV